MKRKSLLLLITLFTIFFSFNIFAMTEKINGEVVPDTPGNEVKNEDRNLDFRWTWINDDMCVQFRVAENWKKSAILKRAEAGVVPRWAESDGAGGRKVKTRDTYTGKWSQDEAGAWSFKFDDCTIPVGVTKIDDVLYAFNTFGELKEGYEYYEGLKTGADGLVVTDNADLNKWLETEYLPSCTSHKE